MFSPLQGCSNARASVISKNMQKQTFMQKTTLASNGFSSDQF
jgi:hypothetical protein